MNQQFKPLCILAFSIAIVWGLSLMLLAWLGLWLSYGLPFIDLLGSVYLGYHATLLGGVIGLMFGFMDMFVGVWVIGWIYLTGCRVCRVDQCCCSPKKKMKRTS